MSKKRKVLKQTYIDSCFSILESTLPESEKFTALLRYDSKFEIGEEVEVFNQFLQK